jgi:peptide-methionine (S)-S-oxide reductase
MYTVFTTSIRMLAVFALTAAAHAANSNASSSPTHSPTTGVATFAGGCFWCVESDFDHVKGVLKTTSGYTGGNTANPTYKSVTQGGSGHFEAVQIHYDPTQVTFEKLANVFWRSVDPLDAGGQFCDRGASYKTAIFAHSEAQTKTAQQTKEAVARRLGGKVATPILTAGEFYAAEDYHQDYAEKNPIRYNFYRYRCGRDARVEELWGDEAHQGINK